MAEPDAASPRAGSRAVSGVSYALPRDTLVVSGPDRKAWLDGLVSCSVPAVVPGTAAYGLLLTKQGKIVTDVFLVDDASTLFVGVAPGRGAPLSELLDRYLVMEDAELGAPTSPLAWRFVSGRGVVVPAAVAQGNVSLAELHAVVAVVPEAGEDVGALSGVALAALWARHGLGVFGVDFGERDNPHEASLDRVAVSWTKGCYLGQEVVCMQDMRGKVKRRLVALEPVGLVEPAVLQDLLGKDVLEAGGSVGLGQVSSVHADGGVPLLLACVASPALESHVELTVNGAKVRPMARADSPESGPRLG